MKKTKAILTLLVLYVLLQFCWWAYMLVDLNQEVFEHKMELAKIQIESGQAQQSALINLDHKLQLRFWMVAGEGFVFICLLVFAVRKLLVAYNKEMELARQQKNFLLSITHEFKSPLAAVRLNMQTMQRHKLSEEREKIIINSTIQEADRLNKLVENALMAAQIETHTYTVTPETFNLSECVKNSLESRMAVRDKEIIKTEIDEDVYIKGDCTAATSMLLNLVENAEKYSGENASIEVKLKQKNKEAVLSIADNGKGIPDAEKGKIFEKFYRVGNEDTRNSKGTGLGLYIVKRLVDMHGARIVVKDNHPAGTVFEIIFPN